MHLNLFRCLQGPIPVRRLFLKVFFWFLFTVWGLHGLVLLSTRFPAMQVVRQPSLSAAIAPLVAAEAIRTYEFDGPEGFVRFVENNRNSKEREIFLLDGFYKDVLHRTISDDGMRTAHAARENQLVIWRGHIAAFRLTSATGHPYVLLVYLTNKYSQIKEMLVGPGGPVVAAILIPLPLLCLWLAFHIASPIHSIQIAARRVAQGDLTARAPDKVLRRHDELAALGHDFNSMVARIEVLVGGHKNVLAAVSHELRSPLARLSVSMALLRRSASNESKHLLDRMDRDIGLMDTLMGQLLTLSRFEAGISGTRRGRVDLAQLVEQVGADGDFEAAAYGKHVQVTVREEAVLASADPYALRSACENLIRNAIRFTSDGTGVQIELAVEGNAHERYVRITVCDEGPGVPEEMLGDIFKPFVRIATGAINEGNNGLGLAIVAGAVQLHHGNVAAANRPAGGLQVVIRLPLGTAATPVPDRLEIPNAMTVS